MSLRYAGAVILIALAGFALVAAFRDRLEPAAVRGALLGGALAVLGAVGGMALLARSLDEGPQTFFGALAGGILGRLVLFCAALVFVGLRGAPSFDLAAVAVSLLTFYLVFQWLELWFVLRRMKRNRS